LVYLVFEIPWMTIGIEQFGLQVLLCIRAFRKYLRWDWLLYGLLLTKQVKPVELADQDRRLPC